MSVAVLKGQNAVSETFLPKRKQNLKVITRTNSKFIGNKETCRIKPCSYNQENPNGEKLMTKKSYTYLYLE
jgi:hypothetical protein